MARSYGKLYVSIWDHTGDFITLTAGAQRLYHFFVSHPQLSACGLLPLQPKKWARFAADLTERSVRKALAELVAQRYVLVDEATEEVLVRTYVLHDGGVRTPNIEKAIRRAIDGIESQPLRDAAEEELGRAIRELIKESIA